MSVETRLKILEKSAPAARLRPAGMSFDDYLARVCAARRANPNDRRAWLEEMTIQELLELIERIQALPAGVAVDSEQPASDRDRQHPKRQGGET